MAIEIIEAEINPNIHQDVEELFDAQLDNDINLDARRRLEDKMEELRLRREMQEFDFDA